MRSEAAEAMADSPDTPPATLRMKKGPLKPEEATVSKLEELMAKVQRAITTKSKLRPNDIMALTRAIAAEKDQYLEMPELVQAYETLHQQYVDAKRLNEIDIAQSLANLKTLLKKTVQVEQAEEDNDGKSEQSFFKKTLALFTDPFKDLKNLVLGKKTPQKGTDRSRMAA